MRVKLKLLGCTNIPVDIGGGVMLPRWLYMYFAEAENGLVDTIHDEDYLDDGIYDIPGFGEEQEDEQDLLGSTAARQVRPGTKREVCEIAARCWS